MNPQNNSYWFGENPMLMHGVPLYDDMVCVCGVITVQN
jgi:hypothetical protein